MVGTPDFRHEAKEALRRANVELSSGDDTRLRYAALELRMCIEALTYGRAAAYKDDFPLEEYSDWQPRRVMSALVALDPIADKGIRLQMSKHPTGSKKLQEWQDMGTERILSLVEIKKHYDALGSWLHCPTPAQRQSMKATDKARFRARCEKIAAILEEVLASPMWNAVVRQHATFDCDRCSNPVRAFRPLGADTSAATCMNCGAGYALHGGKGKKAWWEADQMSCKCPKCKIEAFLWRDEIKQGATFVCEGCQSALLITLGVAVIGAAWIEANNWRASAPSQSGSLALSSSGKAGGTIASIGTLAMHLDRQNADIRLTTQNRSYEFVGIDFGKM